MKYQSEIIHEILEQRGHEKSSLHYQTECIETWIEETKGSYPKLCDYESEWLNYIIENPIGEFPYVTLTDVTEATVDNVVPYAYKSAILSGQTKLMDELGNECEYPNIPKVKMGEWIDTANGKEIASASSFNTTFLKCPTLTFIIKGNNKYKRIIFYDKDKSFISGIDRKINNNSNVTVNSSAIPTNAVYIRISASISEPPSGVSYTPDTKLLIEDENGNNLYITHLETVKMPVLTTTGKNLFDYTKCSTTDESISITNNGLIISMWAKGVPFNHNFTPNTTYTTQAVYEIIEESIGASDLSGGKILLTNGKDYIALLNVGGQTSTFNTPSNIAEFNQLVFYSHGGGGSNDGIIKLTNIQIEQGTQATSYEPYKSNILTVNEDVTLCGIGDVKDTLNLLSGEMVERIGETVIDGNVGWTNNINWSNGDYYSCYTKGITNKASGTLNIISSKYKTGRTLSNNIAVDEFISGETGNNVIYITISKSKLTVDENGDYKSSFINYLNNNPVIVQYELVTESVKTVDLTITNQDGETLNKLKPIEGTMQLSTSGENIKPLFSGEIPVEAITQNLASFIEMEV